MSDDIVFNRIKNMNGVDFTNFLIKEKNKLNSIKKVRQYL